MEKQSMGEMSFEEFAKRAENIYEAVVVMSKRARQIVDEQKRKIELEIELNPLSESRDATDDFDEIEIDREALRRKHTKHPKPTTAAMIEMVDDKIEFRYKEKEENQASQE